MRARVVGCGSPDGGDDQAGLLAAGALRISLPPEVDVQQDLAGGGNICSWCEDADLFVILDAAAASPDFPVGAWRRIDYRSEPRALQNLQMPSTHALGVAGALQLAERIGILPPEVIVYAIAAERFELGSDPSEPVRRAIDEVVRTAAAEILARLRDHACTSSP